MARPPYFPFYVRDFASDPVVEAMSTCGVGAYILLLCKAWHQSPPATLPNDDRVLARYSRLTPDEWREVRSEVTSAFTVGDDGRLHQKRLRQEYEKCAAKSKKSRDAANARWAAGRGDANAYANAKRQKKKRNATCAFGSDSDSDSDSDSGSSRTEENQPARARKCANEPLTWHGTPKRLLETVWNAAPARMQTGRLACDRLIETALDTLAPERFDGELDTAAEWLAGRVAAYGDSPAGRGYFKSLANWLRDGNYDDADEAWNAARADPADVPAETNEEFVQRALRLTGDM